MLQFLIWYVQMFIIYNMPKTIAKENEKENDVQIEDIPVNECWNGVAGGLLDSY